MLKKIIAMFLAIVAGTIFLYVLALTNNALDDTKEQMAKVDTTSATSVIQAADSVPDPEGMVKHELGETSGWLINKHPNTWLWLCFIGAVVLVVLGVSVAKVKRFFQG